MHILEQKQRIVVKIGSSTLTHETGHLNLRRVAVLVETLSDFKNAGHEVVLVSSGAVSAGMAKMSYQGRPESVAEKQALAAVGQSELMKIYDQHFSNYGHRVAQILMTRDVVDDKIRRSKVESTFASLLEMGCVPVVNENDSVSSEEIQFGGNDTLSSYVAIASKANLIINMSDIDGLYDSDPRKNPDAKLIDRIDKIDDTIFAMAGGVGSDRGTGGMATKIKAAKIATDNGIPMLIVNGADPRCLYDILDGKHIGTYFACEKKKKRCCKK